MARRNVAASANGGTATASSTFSGSYPASGAIDGNRLADGTWGSGGGWASTISGSPEWLRVDFSGPMTIDEIDVITYGKTSAPLTLTDTDNVSSYGASAYTIEYWDGASWQTLTTVSGNAYVWRQFTYTPVTTTAIRVTVTNTPDATARLVEVEAWGDDSTTQAITDGTISSGSVLYAPTIAGTTVRISQLSLEIVYAADNHPPVQVSQLALEVIYTNLQELTGGTIASGATVFVPSVSYPLTTGLSGIGPSLTLWPPAVENPAIGRVTNTFLEGFAAADDPTAAVTDAYAETFGGITGIEARVTQVVTEGYAVPDERTARVTQITLEVFGPRREVALSEAPPVGLTWVEFIDSAATTPDG